jgi:hypothetical protein
MEESYHFTELKGDESFIGRRLQCDIFHFGNVSHPGEIVVWKYIYPALHLPFRSNQADAPELDFSDQFAFRPTGSTTAAMISLFHIINGNDLLATNLFVRVFALGFRKAFDTEAQVSATQTCCLIFQMKSATGLVLHKV